VFFKELIEQHRIDRFITHRLRFSFFIAADQIGVDLCYLLGNQTKGDFVSGIDLLLVAECDGFQSEGCFADVVHRFDLLLVTTRRSARSEPAITLNVNNSVSHHSVVDANDPLLEGYCNKVVIAPLIEARGVGRGLGVGSDLGVGVALGVALGVAVAVAV